VGREAKSVPASTWSAAVCRSYARWEKQLAKAGSLGTFATPTAGRDTIVKYFDRAVKATATLAKDVRTAGTPAGKDGSAITAAFTGEVKSIGAAFAKAKADAAQLPTTDPTAFANAARAIETELQAQATALDALISKLATQYPASSVPKAFATAAECRALR
jgi:hypothetical protein